MCYLKSPEVVPSIICHTAGEHLALTLFFSFHAGRVIMRGYHIRIVLNAKSQRSSQSTFTPDSIFDKLPTHPPNPTNRKNATFNSHKKDYRFGPIRIDWMDSNTPVPIISQSSTGKEKDRGGDGISLSKCLAISSDIPQGTPLHSLLRMRLSPVLLIYQRA